MSMHGWVTAGLAVGMLGLAALVVTRPDADAPPTRTDDEMADRVERLEDELRTAMRRLSDRPRVSRQAPPPAVAELREDEPAAASPGDDDPAEPDVDLESRVAAIERKLALLAMQPGIELSDPKTLSKEELRKRVDAMSATNRRGQRGAAGYELEEGFWREYLGRDLTVDERSQALYGLGIALRGLKRHDEEAVVFEEMLQRAGGIETEQGVSASFQLAWARVYGSDNAAAVRAFDDVINSSASSKVLKLHSLLRAGQYVMKDDPQRAREYFVRLTTDHRADVPESQQWLLTNAEQHIREIDGN